MKVFLKPGLTAKTAFLSATLLCVTLFAVALGIFSFHQSQQTISDIAGPRLELLMTATKLVQQSDAIINSASKLLLATDQSQRRQALFDISDRAEWMDKLVRRLQSLSGSSEPLREVLQAKENLLENLKELDALVEQRLLLRNQPPSTSVESVGRAAALATIDREVNAVVSKNTLYSTELGIAVGFHVTKVRDDIIDNAIKFDALMRHRRGYLLAAAVFALAAALLFAAYIQLSIVKRVVKLQHAVSGGRAIPSEIPIDGADEIAELARTMKRYVEKSASDEARILDINKELSFLAAHDSLTKLYNRRHFEKIAEELTASPDVAYCVSVIDIDHFKSINDAYGHGVGDQALEHLAGTIKSGLRNTDILARYGGEEFVVMMLRADIASALHVVERIRAAIESTPLESEHGPIGMTASFGLAERTQETRGVEDCMRCADMALYEAKNTGRNAVVVYAPDMNFPIKD